MPEILGIPVPRFRQWLQTVWDSGLGLREQRLTVQPPGGDEKHWLVDFFPAAVAAGAVRLVGVAFSNATAHTKIADKLQRFSRCAPNGRNGAPPDPWECSPMPAGCLELIRQTTRLLSRSMALRRLVSEMRVSSSLSGQAMLTSGDLGHALHGWRNAPVPDYDPAEDLKNTPVVECWSGFNAPSPRELQVVRFLADGLSNKEIAAALRLSIRTVETYRSRLMSKMKVHSVAEVVRYAIRNNLIQA